jgi:hypothetical protein
MAERPRIADSAAPLDDAEQAQTGESGFTLVELLVAAALSIVVLAATLTLFETLQRNSAGVLTRAATVQAAQAGLREMDSELRQAYQIEFPTSSVTSIVPATGSGNSTTCTASAGVEPCNVVDVLVRLSGTDYEMRFDCTIASPTIPADRSCWRYICSASASTSTNQACASGQSNFIRRNLLIDDITNATSTAPVFSFCYPGTSTQCAAGGTRPTSASVTIDTPAAGTLASTNTGADASTVQMTDDVFMPNLGFGQ